MLFLILILLAHFHCLPCFVLFSVVETISQKVDHRRTDWKFVESVNTLIQSLKSKLHTMSIDDLSESLSQFKDLSEW